MGRTLLNKKQKIYQFDTDPADLAVATIEGGVDCVGTQGTEELFEITGFATEPNDLDMPGFDGLDVPKFPGLKGFTASSMSWYDDEDEQTIFTAFPESASGYMVFCRYGVDIGKSAVKFQYQVASREPSQEGAVVATYTVNFSVLSRTTGVIT